MSRRLVGQIGIFLTLSLCLLCLTTSASVFALQSATYHFDETSIGSGGLIQSSSASYSGSDSISDLSVGNTASANYQVNTGSQTTNDPALSFSITSGAITFPSFSSTTPTVTTATFSVSNYTSYGYVVQVIGNSPSYGSHVIPAMATTGPSQVGIEQFGINLVANTLPISVGVNPDNGQFGFGAAAANYNTSNQYRYVSGETIASAPKSSGLTNYTISYLVNVGALTPGGQYTANQTIIVTGTY